MTVFQVNDERPITVDIVDGPTLKELTAAKRGSSLEELGFKMLEEDRISWTPQPPKPPEFEDTMLLSLSFHKEEALVRVLIKLDEIWTEQLLCYNPSQRAGELTYYPISSM